MSWFPVDDAFHSHPKARKAGMEAVGLWTLAGSHCMAYLTDGFVADWWVKEKPRGIALAQRLVESGLWRRGENAGEQGYWFHDWKPECLKVNVLAAREKARQRKARSRESQRESRVTDDVSPASCLVPTQPNPTQPNNSVVNLGGELTQVAGPPPQCLTHINHDDPPPCHGCRKAREANQAWQAGELDRKRQLREERQRIQANCSRCGGTNTYEDETGVHPCDHQEAAHA